MEAVILKGSLPTGSLEAVEAIKASRVKYLKNFMYQLLENV